MPANRTRSRRSLAALLLVPLVELVILIVLAQHIGALPVLGVVAVSGVLGAAVIRRASPRARATLRELTGRGPTPEHHLSRDARGSGRIMPADPGRPTVGGIAHDLQTVGTDLTEDLLLLLAGVMLAWPGVITGVAALVLLIPAIRRALAGRAARRATQAATAKVDRLVEKSHAQVRGAVIRGETVDHADFVPDAGSHPVRRQIG